MNQIGHRVAAAGESSSVDDSWNNNYWNNNYWNSDSWNGDFWNAATAGSTLWAALVPNAVAASPNVPAPGLAFSPHGDEASSATPMLAITDAKGGGSGQTGTTSGTGTTATTTSSGTSSTSPFVINVVWDASVASAPSGFTTGVMQAVQYLESQFVDPVTINIHIGYGEVGGYALGSTTLGASGAPDIALSYGSLLSALTADNKSATDAAVVASLPAAAPISGTFYVSSAEAKALGVYAPYATSIDGYAGFSSTQPFTYNNSSGVVAGTYDFEGTVLHEISEIMGRTMDFGATTSHNYMLYDLLHYSAPGVRDFSSSTSGYFSPNGGVTNDGTLNTVSGGDGSDWASSVGSDSFDAFAYSGVVNAFTANDRTVMDALGWDPVTATALPTTSTSTLTGVTETPVTTSLAQALLGAAAIATVNQTGGSGSETYGYALGGTGAAAFTLTTSNNTAQLASGAAGLAGSVSGSLYALTLTATDLTTGQSAPAAALDVIAGTAGNDTISAANVAGTAASAAPTFIYGGSGNDTLDATGLTGNVWFVGGGGADHMTAGSGSDSFIYSSDGDSTPAAMDVIARFAPGMDKVDLTGLGTSLQYAGAIKTRGSGANTLAAHSIGTLVSGGNTYVYVNTSGSGESVSGTNMKMELLGSMSLSTSNFLHQ